MKKRIKNNIDINNRKPRKYKLIRTQNARYSVFEEKDINVQYFMYLAKKYCLSNGIKFDEKDIDTKEFTDWLYDYVEATNKYADFLSAYEVELNDSTLAETGKGKFDSIIGGASTEISAFSEMMERPKIIFGDVKKGLLIHNNKRILTLDDLGIDRLMTQNPNFYGEVDNFATFANELHKEITFGVYGNFSDKDINNKTNMIKRLLETTDNTIFEYDTFKDYYFIFVSTISPKIKVKKLSL